MELLTQPFIGISTVTESSALFCKLCGELLIRTLEAGRSLTGRNAIQGQLRNTLSDLTYAIKNKSSAWLSKVRMGLKRFHLKSYSYWDGKQPCSCELSQRKHNMEEDKLTQVCFSSWMAQIEAALKPMLGSSKPFAPGLKPLTHTWGHPQSCRRHYNP